MSKTLVLILVNLMMLLLFYICGVVAGASFNVFEWSEGCRIGISLSYGTIAIIVNAVIGTEYKT